jgi:two-component system sensor kinase FixL
MQKVLSEDHLVDLLDDLHIAMLVFDENLLLTWSSDAALTMDGRTESELIGELAWDLWPAWQMSELGKALIDAIAKQEPRTVRFRFLSKHNSFWATARVKPWKGGAAIVIRNLNQDERDEVNREQLGSRYNFTRMAGSDIFWEWHLDDDRVVVNAAAVDLLGEVDGLVERDMHWWLERVHPDDRRSLKAASNDAYDRKDVEWTANFRLKTKQGRYIPVLLRGFHVYAAAGTLERIIATAIDLSAVKEAETKAKQLQDELVHVSSVNAMGAMASTLAHELNQPLTAISNYLGGCEMMLRGDEVDLGMLIEAVGMAKGSVKAAGDIIKGLRLSAFNKGLVKSRIDLREAIDAALLQVMLSADRDYLTIKMNLPKDVFILGDAVQIKHALMILIHNAIDSMTGMDEKYLMLDATTFDENVVLILADNGPTIPVADRSKFFDPFFSTKERGIGLGFLVSRTIIEEHEGKIWLDENSDIGAKFVIELPLAA